MTKNLHHAAPLACAVPGCTELPQLGSPFCLRHAAAKRGERRVPSWMLWPILLLLIGAIALLVANAEQLFAVG